MKLKYREDGTFKIVQLTDLHIGSLPHHEDDYKTFDLIDKAFEKLDADLVMITGDLIWSDGVPNADQVFTELLEQINKHNVPVAITYGNHDAEDEFVRSDMRKMESILEIMLKRKTPLLWKIVKAIQLKFMMKKVKALKIYCMSLTLVQMLHYQLERMSGFILNK